MHFHLAFPIFADWRKFKSSYERYSRFPKSLIVGFLLSRRNMAIRNNEKPETALQKVYRMFWDGFNTFTKNDPTFCHEFKVHPYPSIRSYQDYSIGEPYHLFVGINFKRHEIRIGAYFRDLDVYSFYNQKLKGRIEDKIGKSLKWTRHQTKASALLYVDDDFDENQGWINAFKSIVHDMCLMKTAFEVERQDLRNR